MFCTYTRSAKEILHLQKMPGTANLTCGYISANLIISTCRPMLSVTNTTILSGITTSHDLQVESSETSSTENDDK